MLIRKDNRQHFDSFAVVGLEPFLEVLLGHFDFAVDKFFQCGRWPNSVTYVEIGCYVFLFCHFCQPGISVRLTLLVQESVCFGGSVYFSVKIFARNRYFLFF